MWNMRKTAAGRVHALPHWTYYFLKASYTDFKTRYLMDSGIERKRLAALPHWLYKYAEEGSLQNNHFQYYYTDHVGLDYKAYSEKRVLDIGCGPRGSLEWAENATKRVGVDPAKDLYQPLGISDQSMEYIDSKAENLPFEDESFDIVISGNSLDHVEDIDQSIEEIKRVTAHGGTFILITGVNEEETLQEPQTLTWDIIHRFEPEFEVVYQDRRHKDQPGIYESAKHGSKYDMDSDEGIGVLSARFEKSGE